MEKRVAFLQARIFKKSLSVILIAGLAVVFLAGSGFRSLDRPDLSTPQKAFGVLVQTLKSGQTESLAQIATETGVESLLEVKDYPEFEGDISSLGNELEQADLSWDAITDDIYVASALEGNRTHKMEFTREEPGWMLYHWQVRQ